MSYELIMLSELPYSHIYCIFQPESRAAILSWFADYDVARSHKEAFINVLINFDDRCNHFFSHQAYFLAAEAIAFFPDCSQADAIVGQLLKWSYSFCRTSKSDWKIYPRALTIAAREALKRTDIKRVANRLAEVIHTADSLVVLRRAAEELGRLNPGDESAIAALERLIQYPQPLRNSIEAITSLIVIDPQNPLIVSSLLEIINSDEAGFYVLRDAMWALREVAVRDEAAIKTTCEFIDRMQQHIECQSDKQLSEDHPDLFLCNQSVKLLGVIGVGSQPAISSLLSSLRQTGFYAHEFYPSEQFFGCEAVDALGSVAIDNSTAIAELTQMLSDAQEPLLCCHVAAALLRIDRNNSKAMTVLTEILETAQVAQTEVKLLELETFSRSELRELPEYLLWRAADSLARNDPNSQSAIGILIQLVQTSISDTPCLPILYSLLDIDSTKQLAINALMQLLETKPDDFLCEALPIFRGVEVGNELVIDALTRLIQRSQSQSNRYAAAGALGTVDPGNSFAIATLIELLESDDRFLWSIAQELGNIGIDDEQAISALLKFVQTFQRTSDRRDRQRLTDCFKHLKSKELLSCVVQELKDYLDPKQTDLDDDQFEGGAYFEWEDVEGVRSEVAYQIIWNCAQNMSYPDFYQAWTGEGL
ncbi:PBS lyase HEAT domain protein repeat-containing protein [Leptolyngbya sp. NIES-3755]|nr:PBS lyase HEAT domain protein repeat-containing protein [Leptolyngbya sp. NIES-3755]